MSLQLVFKLYSDTNVHNCLNANRVGVNPVIVIGAWNFPAKAYKQWVHSTVHFYLVFERVFEMNSVVAEAKTDIPYGIKGGRSTSKILYFTSQFGIYFYHVSASRESQTPPSCLNSPLLTT